jgi:hypothetical protein
MAHPIRRIGFRDELLTGGTVCRRYDDGLIEWRTRDEAGGIVNWRDNRGATGIDEALGDRIVKRTVVGRQPIYGREQGFGRTLWSDGRLTVNETGLKAKFGRAAAFIGGGILLSAFAPPPHFMTADEEQHLREQHLATQRGPASDSSFGGTSGGFDDDFG